MINEKGNTMKTEWPEGDKKDPTLERDKGI